MPQNIFYGYKNIKVTFQPNIGLDANVRQSVIDMLNLLLADEAVLSFKAHKAGENTTETGVPDLVSLYNDQYKQMAMVSEEIVKESNHGGHTPSCLQRITRTCPVGGGSQRLTRPFEHFS